jgi:carbohydrate diacid regulator
MNISAKQAMNIVESLRDVIAHDINFIDLNSIIIASSNASRIGDFHEGSKIVYDTQKALIIYGEDDYEGAKPGINLPVTFDDEIVAVIGITGEYDVIKKFSDVIVKMTEILIKEFYFRDQKEMKQENIRYIVELIINDLESPKAILKKAQLLNIHLEHINKVAVMKLENIEHKYSNMRRLIQDSIKHRLSEHELVVNYQGDFILLLDQTDAHKLNNIMNYVTSKYSIALSVGYSNSIDSFDKVYHGYLNAQRIADLAHKIGRFELVTLSDFDLELILLDVDKAIQETFIEKVFHKVDQDTLEQWHEMLMSFAKNNGSINATSEELFIHKNTLQYRLKKIKEVTGYDPRNLRDFTVLYLAILLQNQ